MHPIVTIVALILLIAPVALPGAICLIGKFDGRTNQIVGMPHILLSVLLISIALPALFGFSFRSETMNGIAILVIVMVYTYLAFAVRTLRPKSIAVISMACSMVGLFLFTAFFGLNLFVKSIDGPFEYAATLNGTFCEVQSKGFAGEEGGYEISIYKPVWFGLQFRSFRNLYLDSQQLPFGSPREGCEYALAKNG